MRATPEKARGFNQLLKNYGTRVNNCKNEVRTIKRAIIEDIRTNLTLYIPGVNLR